MRLKVKHFLFCILSFFVCHSTIAKQNINHSGSISGQIHLDSSWAPTLYMSYIEDFNSLYSISSSMIIQKVDIDNEGYFSFDLEFLPKEDNLYRIHFVKKGEPDASIIIGGSEENHFFIFANRFSNIRLKKSKEEKINDIKILDSPINLQFSQVKSINNYLDSSNIASTQIKRTFIKKAGYEKLRSIADTCQHSLLSLYAIYSSKFATNYNSELDFYDNYNQKWADEESSYFKVFRKQLPLKKRGFPLLYIGFILVGLTFGILLGKTSLFKRKEVNKLSVLSIQERKIFLLLQEGYSNQDISDQCNIGVSTVKSHVSAIYSKLKIKSRKEAVNLKN